MNNETLPTALVERGLDRAKDLGAIRAWAPAASLDASQRRRWVVVYPDGSRETMPVGAAWAYVRGLRDGVEIAASR